MRRLADKPADLFDLFCLFSVIKIGKFRVRPVKNRFRYITAER